MLLLATLIVIPVIGSYICSADDMIQHSQGTQDHEIVNSIMGEMADHCCDEHSHHDLNLIASSSNYSSLSASVSAYQRLENDALHTLPPLAVERPPSN